MLEGLDTHGVYCTITFLDFGVDHYYYEAHCIACARGGNRFSLSTEDGPKKKLLVQMAGSSHLDGRKCSRVCRQDEAYAVRAISPPSAVYDMNSSQDPHWYHTHQIPQYCNHNQ